jgi:hypothetical protein
MAIHNGQTQANKHIKYISLLDIQREILIPQGHHKYCEEVYCSFLRGITKTVRRYIVLFSGASLIFLRRYS